MPKPASVLSRPYLTVGILFLFLSVFVPYSSAREPIGVANLEHFERLPYFKDGIRCEQTSSQSRAGTDDYIESYGDVNHILLDVKGPGCVYRLWFTEMSTTGKIIIYLDGQETPIINKEYYSFINNLSFPFIPPLVGNYKLSSGGYYNFLPMPFKKSCKIIGKGVFPMFFFNVTYHLFNSDKEVETFSLNMSKDDVARINRIKDTWQAVGTSPLHIEKDKLFSGTKSINAGETAQLSELSGPGAVTALKIDISPANRTVLENCRLNIFWDNETKPSVNAPIGHFFGSGLGEVDFKSLPIGMSKSGWYYCYFPMPFWKSAKITIVNNSKEKVEELKYEIYYNNQPYEKGRAGYFKALYNKEHPISGRKDYTILETKGRGHFVGTTLTAGGQGMKTWEGDERIYIDGSATPQLHGSGAEDYFNGAWYFKHGYFSLPTHGYTAKTTETINNQKILHLNCYRFHISDYIPFNSSIKVGIEHGNHNRVTGYYSSVAYYYAVDKPNLSLIDELNIGDKDSEQKHKYTAADSKALQKVKSTYIGEKEYQKVYDNGVIVNKNSQFQITLNPNNQGVRVRRKLYYTKSTQEANIWVDDKLVGTWYTTPNPLLANWLETEYEIPAKYTAGKDSLLIKIEPTSPGKNWNEFHYWFYYYEL